MNDIAATPDPVSTQQDIPVDANPAHVAPEGRAAPPIEPEPTIEEVEAKAEPETKDEPKKPSKSVDEALEKALKASQEKAKAKEVEAEPEKVDAKESKQRTPEGKFTKKDAEGEQPEQARPQEPPKTYAEPPARFHESAKAEWAATPESVRAEVTRATQELERGIEKYRAQVAEYDEIKEYRDLAKQHGVTIKSALDNYVGIENLLRQNPLAGLEQVMQNLGLKKSDGSLVTLYDVAHNIVNQNPDARASQQSSTIASLRQEIAELKGAVQQTQGYVEQQRLAPGISAIQEFSTKNPRFNEVSSEVLQVLNSGLIPADLPINDRLDRAYKTVIFNIDGELPSAHTARTPSQDTGAQTAAPVQPLNPAGQKSVSGAPSAVAPKVKTAAGTAPSIEEALQRALRKAS